MGKTQKTAVQIADLIRERLNESELRIGVFSDPTGWHATVYAAPQVALKLQTRVDRVSKELRGLYELTP